MICCTPIPTQPNLSIYQSISQPLLLLPNRNAKQPKATRNFYFCEEFGDVCGDGRKDCRLNFPLKLRSFGVLL